MYYQYTTTCSCVLLHLALCINRLSRSINKSSFRWWIGSFTVYLAKMPQAPKAGFAWVKSVTWVKALISTSHYNLSWQTYHENCSKSFILQHLWRYFFLYEAWSTIKLDQISSQQFFDLRNIVFLCLDKHESWAEETVKNFKSYQKFLQRTVSLRDLAAIVRLCRGMLLKLQVLLCLLADTNCHKCVTSCGCWI